MLLCQDEMIREEEKKKKVGRMELMDIELAQEGAQEHQEVMFDA